MRLRTIFLFILSIASIQISFADNETGRHIEPDYFDLPVNSDTSISITRFGHDGDRVLWIPSEYGVNKKRHYELLHSLAKLGHEVWLADIHESYFIPPGRSSYAGIPVDEIAALIEKSLPQGKRKLFIVSTGRGSAISLLALNNWQRKTGGSANFGGIVMLHPNFQADTPIPGTAMKYLPIVDSAQFPIFIIQPKKSNKYWYLGDLIARLNDSGSQVYTQIIEQVSDGYHIKPDATENEKKIARKLPGQIAGAIHMLSQVKITPDRKTSQAETLKILTIPETLQPYQKEALVPELEQQDLAGKMHALQDYRGKVIVLNFWATWCTPCVEEIPSLGRLQKSFPEKDLIVLSVDIGESKKEIENFLEQVPADFPVLLDPDGSLIKRWKIIAFPTTFVIDKKGAIKLAYYGALKWDAPNIVEQLRGLLE
ncbi:MAG TPA: TlpA family protein disulfide reductase [Gammaproteobacteria bacterium]|nr:TlpA family protein disulfide reductase [Gammaproteobacteria bacterium]